MHSCVSCLHVVACGKVMDLHICIRAQNERDAVDYRALTESNPRISYRLNARQVILVSGVERDAVYLAGVYN